MIILTPYGARKRNLVCYYTVSSAVWDQMARLPRIKSTWVSIYWGKASHNSHESICNSHHTIYDSQHASVELRKIGEYFHTSWFVAIIVIQLQIICCNMYIRFHDDEDRGKFVHLNFDIWMVILLHPIYVIGSIQFAIIPVPLKYKNVSLIFRKCLIL